MFYHGHNMLCGCKTLKLCKKKKSKPDACLLSYLLVLQNISVVISTQSGKKNVYQRDILYNISMYEQLKVNKILSVLKYAIHHTGLHGHFSS